MRLLGLLLLIWLQVRLGVLKLLGSLGPLLEPIRLLRPLQLLRLIGVLGLLELIGRLPHIRVTRLARACPIFKASRRVAITWPTMWSTTWPARGPTWSAHVVPRVTPAPLGSHAVPPPFPPGPTWSTTWTATCPQRGPTWSAHVAPRGHHSVRGWRGGGELFQRRGHVVPRGPTWSHVVWPGGPTWSAHVVPRGVPTWSEVLRLSPRLLGS